MTPLPPGALEHLLKTLPPERDDPFPHLEDLTPDQLLQRRVVISTELKTLEEERREIDAELTTIFSDAELRQGVRAPGGWVVKRRSRTSWDYPQDLKDTIKHLQQQAQHDGSAQRLMSTYLYLSVEETRDPGTAVPC